MPVAPEAQLAEKGCRKGLLDPTMNGGGSLPCEWNIPTEAAACCLLLAACCCCCCSGFFHWEARRLGVGRILRTPKTGTSLNLSCSGVTGLLTLGVALVVFRHLAGLT